MDVRFGRGTTGEAEVKLNSQGEIRYITYDGLAKYDRVSAFTTVRLPAVDALKSNDPGLMLEGLGEDIAAVLGVPFRNFIVADQVHSSNVFAINAAFINQLGSPDYLIMSSMDGFITDLKRVPLLIFTADCLPIFLYDSSLDVAGLVHAGRKGTEAAITRLAVRDLVRKYNCAPEDITALIGSSIGPCCYPVDLWAENERQLREENVGEIVNPGICTGCNTDRFYSYRVEKGMLGRMVSVIMLR